MVDRCMSIGRMPPVAVKLQHRSLNLKLLHSAMAWSKTISWKSIWSATRANKMTAIALVRIVLVKSAVVVMLAHLAKSSQPDRGTSEVDRIAVAEATKTDAKGTVGADTGAVAAMAVEVEVDMAMVVGPDAMAVGRSRMSAAVRAGGRERGRRYSFVHQRE